MHSYFLKKEGKNWILGKIFETFPIKFCAHYVWIKANFSQYLYPLFHITITITHTHAPSWHIWSVPCSSRSCLYEDCDLWLVWSASRPTRSHFYEMLASPVYGGPLPADNKCPTWPRPCLEPADNPRGQSSAHPFDRKHLSQQTCIIRIQEDNTYAVYKVHLFLAPPISWLCPPVSPNLHDWRKDSSRSSLLWWPCSATPRLPHKILFCPANNSSKK